MPPERYKIKFLSTAAQEVKDIIRDCQRDYGNVAAQKIREDLVTRPKELLSQNPFLSRPLYEYPEYEKKGLRRYIPHQHFSLLYIVIDDTVEIWHVWDNRRDWTTLFEN